MASGRYLALLDKMRDLHVRKSAGYAGKDNPDTWANFREAERWGLTPLQGCLVRMGDKFVRVQNLVRDPANEQVGEAIRDTLMDAAAYALIAVCLLDEQEQGPEEPVWPDSTLPNAFHAEGPRCEWYSLHWHPSPAAAAFWPIARLAAIEVRASGTIIRPIKGWLTGDRLWHELEYEECAKRSLHAHRLDVEDGLGIEYATDYVAPRGKGTQGQIVVEI